MSEARTILITGANGGLGIAIAREFLEHDPSDRVWLGVRSNREAADALAETYGGRVSVVTLDVADAGAWDRAVDSILEADGRIDVLVNNAGSHRDSLLATMDDDTWADVIESNLTGVFYGCRKVARTMLVQRSGRVINISSLSALMPPVGQANYAAAKAGVLTLTKTFDKEVARAGVTVNAICPGFIDTEALADMADDARRAAMRSVPMRRFGQPGEVAVAVRFLACPEAAYITGSVLNIDGGIS